MIQVRRSADRGHFDHGWLDTYHTFSFADYHDPAHMGFRALRVINEDRVAPGGGFGMHPHRDMEIVTVVLSGALEHRDSLGHTGGIRPGEVQAMTTGTGVQHSEYNPSRDEPVHLMQIWLRPEARGLVPRYSQASLPAPGERSGLTAIAAGGGRTAPLRIEQDAALLFARLTPGEEVRYDLAPQRHAWIQVLRGAIELNGLALQAGDGAAVSDERALRLSSTETAEALLFDLA
jgi:redox-sensitive bicupin YhaK (pirin superfamily)